MNLETRKLIIIEKFIHVQNDAIITQFEKILAKVQEIPKTKTVKSLTIDEFNTRIKKSMHDSNKGCLTSHKDLESEIEKWN